MTNNCIICLENLFLPVEIICFGCYKNYEINCSSLSRICLKCANTFLQLDKNIEDRDYYKKCIYCSSLCYLHKINCKNAFKKDFYSMIKDTNIYNCPYCFAFTDDQISICNHLEKDCPKYYVLCDCKKIFIREDFYFHLFSCPKYSFCNICKKYVNKNIFNNHMQNEHDYIYCNLCKDYFKKLLFENHIENECPERLIVCTFCLQLIIYKDYKKHLLDHRIDLLNNLDELNNKYNQCIENLNKINEILIPTPNLLE